MCVRCPSSAGMEPTKVRLSVTSPPSPPIAYLMQGQPPLPDLVSCVNGHGQVKERDNRRHRSFRAGGLLFPRGRLSRRSRSLSLGSMHVCAQCSNNGAVQIGILDFLLSIASPPRSTYIAFSRAGRMHRATASAVAGQPWPAPRPAPKEAAADTTHSPTRLTTAWLPLSSCGDMVRCERRASW